MPRPAAAGRPKPHDPRDCLTWTKALLVMPVRASRSSTERCTVPFRTREQHRICHSKVPRCSRRIAAAQLRFVVPRITLDAHLRRKGRHGAGRERMPLRRDPRTAGRQLEELASSRCSAPSVWGHAAKSAVGTAGARRAEDLRHRRGAEERARVWSATTNTWQILPLNGSIGRTARWRAAAAGVIPRRRRQLRTTPWPRR
jgi:hypothetical protein